MISGLVSSSSIKNDSVAAVVSCPVKTIENNCILHGRHDTEEAANLSSDEQGYNKEIQVETVATVVYKIQNMVCNS